MRVEAPGSDAKERPGESTGFRCPDDTQTGMPSSDSLSKRLSQLPEEEGGEQLGGLECV